MNLITQCRWFKSPRNHLAHPGPRWEQHLFDCLDFRPVAENCRSYAEKPGHFANSGVPVGNMGFILPRPEQKRARELLTRSRELLKQVQTG